MFFRRKNFVFIGIGFTILLAFVVAYVDNVSIEQPWQGMSCDEMIGLAMSPEHQTFSEKQHIEFHKDLERCVGKTLPSHM